MSDMENVPNGYDQIPDASALINSKFTEGGEKYFFRASAADFKKIPGSPIAYWVSEKVVSIFDRAQSFEDIGNTRRGLQTGNAELFVKKWHEVSSHSIGRNLTKMEAPKSNQKWFLFNSGGTYRKWSGNIDDVVNWFCDGQDIKATGKAIIPSEDMYFSEAVTWPKVSSGKCSFRYFPSGIVPGDAGPCFFSNIDNIYWVLLFGNSKVALSFLQFLSPTLNFEVGVMAKMPVMPTKNGEITVRSKTLIKIAQDDWNMNETAQDFEIHLLVNCGTGHLADAYSLVEDKWKQMVEKMQRLEEENNSFFIKAYGLQDELTPEVPLSEITLTCNPHYRYGSNKSEQELEDLLRADTMREFISYAVGCMFGRYSLDQPGLILANQGETLGDYLRQVPQPRFMPDNDNVIPLLDGDWFTDDITGRFREFLRITFGDEHYEENLRFIETALGKKDKPLAIRDYFLKEFYADHVKRYKKRPIYWLFSSPKGSFNALIYLHRYRPDTASIVLQYLRDFRSKLASERDHQEQMSISSSASQGEKTKALKKIEELKKTLVELDDYERETLYPLATQQVALDLDDGVKVNYVKLGAALKKIPGLDVADE